MESREKIRSVLKKESDQLPVPESLTPENMRKKLINHMEEQLESMDLDEEIVKNVENPPQKRSSLWKPLMAAACICMILGAVWAADQKKVVRDDSAVQMTEEEVKEEEILEIADNTVTYQQIYGSMQKVWEKNQGYYRGDIIYDFAEMSDGTLIAEESAAAEGSSTGVNSAAADKQYFNGYQEKELFGETNVQTAGIDEGDIIKNDGRYLYQLMRREKEGVQEQVIQIIDTKDGLQELSVIEKMDSVEEFYVWKDLLIVIQRKYVESSGWIPVGKAMCEVGYDNSSYHQISIFDLQDRTKPEKLKTFTLQGSYASSRIADGYFYGFSRYYADPGNGEADLNSYIPCPDGARLLENQIVLPEGSEGTAYLVLVSIDLNDPTKFVQTAGIVTGSELFYVSESSIYVTDYQGTEYQTGSFTDKTMLMRFSYGEGKFRMEAEGEVSGYLNDTFSLNESEGYLRVVSTVNEYEGEMMVDDRTGQEIGIEIMESHQTNALYVFDKNLNLTGKIEGLAENEQIYSARFFGDTGYFVTFRQVDPLFAADLSDPQNPQILDELKVSGFSEYLHFYSEDRLLGIGMEADEETGQTEGMKLSMFDISDPTKLSEISKESLGEYDYSEGLYNYRAVMISPAANLFGFMAEGNSKAEGYVRHYLVYSYENDEFVQRLKLDAASPDGGYDTVRGTFIGEAFYLLCGDGRVEKYDLNSGKLLESLSTSVQ